MTRKIGCFSKQNSNRTVFHSKQPILMVDNYAQLVAIYQNLTLTFAQPNLPQREMLIHKMFNTRHLSHYLVSTDAQEHTHSFMELFVLKYKSCCDH